MNLSRYTSVTSVDKIAKVIAIVIYSYNQEPIKLRLA